MCIQREIEIYLSKVIIRHHGRIPFIKLYATQCFALNFYLKIPGITSASKLLHVWPTLYLTVQELELEIMNSFLSCFKSTWVISVFQNSVRYEVNNLYIFAKCSVAMQLLIFGKSKSGLIFLKWELYIIIIIICLILSLSYSSKVHHFVFHKVSLRQHFKWYFDLNVYISPWFLKILCIFLIFIVILLYKEHI